ncbi:sugar kinase [Aquibacillus rhizosphaerae]|uniref:Sugar kinase n=1 Tax=Aquibacillus rhizosphaerae TaxID=3051431 RepID=A0ABT7L346_9BACI|nr:sugar kinase [Aquibacillus sp. LR5S19]MDL4840285.1 sugar kinase [Aquibacillus sp. LR5S19]
MKKIVTMGELLIRLSTNVGERLSTTNQLHMHYGGAETNVAISLANIGYDVNFVSKIPDNLLGNGAESHLRANNVQTDFLLKGGERLGTYYMESGVGQRNAMVVYDRKYSSFAEISTDELDFSRVFEGVDLFHVTGITPALSPALSKITLRALKTAQEKGVLTSFDFNYRSKLWRTDDAALVFKELLPYVDICFMGEMDAVHFLGIERANQAMDGAQKLDYYYREVQSSYPNIKHISCTFRDVISASKHKLQGNYFKGSNIYQSVMHTIDPVVDRVGGGDAFAAGILYGILEGLKPNKLVSFATAGSVLKHTLHGDCNTFSLEEIIAFAENGSGKISR